MGSHPRGDLPVCWGLVMEAFAQTSLPGTGAALGESLDPPDMKEHVRIKRLFGAHVSKMKFENIAQ